MWRRCRSHTSSVECVYGRPRVSAKRGVVARSAPRHGLALSRAHNECAALVGSLGRKGSMEGKGEYMTPAKSVLERAGAR
eukprot:3547471-Pleurochrysis_carterae.AAC.1